jgi:hypothetical protein
MFLEWEQVGTGGNKLTEKVDRSSTQGFALEFSKANRTDIILSMRSTVSRMAEGPFLGWGCGGSPSMRSAVSLDDGGRRGAIAPVGLGQSPG